MIKKLAIALGLFLTAYAGSAMAATPFGGDDTGFVPPGTPKSDFSKCEDKVAQNVKTTANCLVKCHRKRALKVSPNDTAEDNCETGDPKKSCFARYQKREASILKTSKAHPVPCPACLDSAAQDALLNGLEPLFENTNGQIYCSDGNGSYPPFGGDDTGFIPPRGSHDGVCENAVSRGLGGRFNRPGGAISCIFDCHRNRAKLKLGNDVAEEICEDGDPKKSCLAKYLKDIRAVHDCPACLDSFARDDLFAQFETILDGTNGGIYCASPSGAFLDGMPVL